MKPKISSTLLIPMMVMAVAFCAHGVVFDFVDGSDAEAINGGPGQSWTIVGTSNSVTLTTVDVIGDDGSSALDGSNNTVNVDAWDSLTVDSWNTNDWERGIDASEGWVFNFDRDVTLTELEFESLDEGYEVTLSSPAFTTAVQTNDTLRTGEGRWALNLDVPAGTPITLINTGFGEFRIESVTILSDEPPNEDVGERAYDFELVADGAVIADQSTGRSANASVIRVPDWIPPGQRAATNANYYMYYGQHSGPYIQMKWAETLDGPWMEFNLGGTYNGQDRRGVFDTDADATREDYDHVFSPDVHVDDINQQIVMYYHGQNQPSTTTLTTGQKVPNRHANFVATSHYGLNFNDPDEAGGDPGHGPIEVTFDGITREVFLGDVYQRVFEFRGNYYSLSKRAIMAMAPDPSDPWAPPADDPGTSTAEPFNMAWVEENTPSDLWINDANPGGQDSYFSPAATFLASSAFAVHPNNPHPGRRIFSEGEHDDGLRLNHCSLNLLAEQEQLEVFFYVRADVETDLYDDEYRIVLDISHPDFQQWTVATNGDGLHLFDVVVTDDEIAAAVQAANPGADPDVYADPSSMGMGAVFVDDDGGKYLFCTYYSAVNGGSSGTSEGQITAIRLFPAYDGHDAWVSTNFPSGYPGRMVDSDLDGFDNFSEFIAGTDPNDQNEKFVVNGVSSQPDVTVDWHSVSGRVYSVYWTDQLTNNWQMVTNGLPYPQNSWTDTGHSGDDAGFYRITVEMD
ncbi:hypothetical protein PDESU_00304 [Pontiella desulfatans]|uniref:Uncharacterized protein n=1 Tax=Pontiella desulfatans TaxID=2750659 RepID=A0A6C2TVR9_PONDE|nr:hypothetical protein [Pontiella desulfatans]VGO11758.1 hypothetical protein PDESU_00304 [Pontiella desulfatans]